MVSSERELSLPPVLSPTLSRGHLPWEEGSRKAARSEDGYPALCWGLAARGGPRRGSPMWGGGASLQEGRGGWRELLINLGSSCFSPFCQTPFGPPEAAEGAHLWGPACSLVQVPCLASALPLAAAPLTPSHLV